MALKVNAECTAAQYGLGQIALSQRNYAEALKLFKQALAAASDANRIRYGLALAYLVWANLSRHVHLSPNKARSGCGLQTCYLWLCRNWCAANGCI
jgi:hypothetical protein